MVASPGWKQRLIVHRLGLQQSSVLQQTGRPFGIVVERLADPMSGDIQEMMMSLMSSTTRGKQNHAQKVFEKDDLSLQIPRRGGSFLNGNNLQNVAGVKVDKTLNSSYHSLFPLAEFQEENLPSGGTWRTLEALPWWPLHAGLRLYGMCSALLTSRQFL